MRDTSLRSALQLVASAVAAVSLGTEDMAAATEHAAHQAVGDVVFVAHRGGIVPGYPENTLAAFRHAIELGVHAIEIDLRGTKDGAIVIMHDASVDRTTNGRGTVEELTLGELKALDAGGGEPVPTYEEVLELIAGTEVALLLDIKEGGTLERSEVVRATRDHDAIRNVIVGARTLDDLRVFRELDETLRTLGFVAKIEDIEAFSAAGVDIVRLWPEWIRADADLVGSVHRLGRPASVTAGGAPLDELVALIALGVDGVLSDLPALARPLLSR